MAKQLPMIGGDPEAFIWNNTTDSAVISCGQIGGTKGAGVPIPTTSLRSKQLWLEDNVAVEVNFPPQVDTDHLIGLIDTLRAHVDSSLHAKNGQWSARWAVEAEFNKAHLDKFPASKEIGCEPDFYAYSRDSQGLFDPDKLQRNCLNANVLGNKRYAGGHLHLSFDNRQNIPAFAIAMLCDAVLGLPSVVMDKQHGRRRMYGLAGLYRPKSYGIEYRTMSNWWMREPMTGRQQDFRYLFFRQAFRFLHMLEALPDPVSDIFATLPLHDIRGAIESENTGDAYQLYRQVYGTFQSNKFTRSSYPLDLDPSWVAEKVV